MNENSLIISEQAERTFNLIKTAAPREHAKTFCSPRKHLAGNSIALETETKDITILITGVAYIKRQGANRGSHHMEKC